MRILLTVGSAAIFVAAMMNTTQGMQPYGQPGQAGMQPQPYPQGTPYPGMQPQLPYSQGGMPYGQPNPQLQSPMQPYQLNPQMLEQQQRMMFFRTYPMANEMDWNRYKQMNNMR